MVSQSFFLALGVLGCLTQGAEAGTKKKCIIRTSSGLSLTTGSTAATSSIPGSTSQATSSLLSGTTVTSSGLTTGETQAPTSLSSQASTVSDSASISVSIAGSAFTSSTASASAIATGSSTMSSSIATLTSTTTTSVSVSTSAQTSISSTQSTSAISGTLSTTASSSITTSASSSTSAISDTVSAATSSGITTSTSSSTFAISDTLSTTTSSSIATSASSSQISSGSTSASDPSSTTTTSQATPTRPIVNGGFEDYSNSISPWTLLNAEGSTITAVLDTSISQYGPNAAKLVSPEGEEAFLTQDIYKPLVQPNQDYTFSAWFRISGSSFPACNIYRLFCSSQDGSNAGQVSNFRFVAGEAWQVGSTNCRWSQSQYDAGDLMVNLGISCDGPISATAWIDSAALGPAPTGA